MTAAMIVLAVLLAVVLLALGLFLFACRRSPVPDFTKPAVIAQWGREDQTEEILAGITLMQDAEDIFLPSHDGLRLHGQLLQQPGAKGTMMEMGLCPTAPPTAWADIRRSPRFRATASASAL